MSGKSVPQLKDYGLSAEKIALLSDPQLHRAIKQRYVDTIRIFHMVFGVLAFALWLYILLSLMHHINGFLSFIIAIVVAFLFYNLLKRLLRLIKFRFNGIAYVNLDEEDIKAYTNYKMDCDEFNHTQYFVNWGRSKFLDGSIELYIDVLEITITISAESKIKFESNKHPLIAQFPVVIIICSNRQYKVDNMDAINEIIAIFIKYFIQLKKEFLLTIPEWQHNQGHITKLIDNSRSRYLQYLRSVQCDDKDIIQHKECLSHKSSSSYYFEDAFVFTIDNKKGGYYVVYENENDARVSIISQVNTETEYYNTLRTLLRHLKSVDDNKRERLHQTHMISDVCVRLVKHSDLVSWKSKIFGSGHARVVKITHRRHRLRWR